MKRIRYMTIGAAIFMMLSCISFSSLNAQDESLRLIVDGTLLVKKTKDAQSPTSVIQTALSNVYLHMEFLGNQVMGAVELFDAPGGIPMGAANYMPPRVNFTLYNSSTNDDIKAGEMVLKGHIFENGTHYDNFSNFFHVVVYNEDVIDKITVQKGVAEVEAYSSGTLECGFLSDYDCFLSYEMDDSSIADIDADGILTGKEAGTTELITKVTIPGIGQTEYEVSRTTIKVEDTNTPTPPVITTDYIYELILASLEESYAETKLGNVKIENSDQSTPANHYYTISDTTKFRIDDAGNVYAKTGMSAGTHSFTITVYKDAGKTDVAKTFTQTITITPVDTPTPNPNPDDDPTPAPNPSPDDDPTPAPNPNPDDDSTPVPNPNPDDDPTPAPNPEIPTPDSSWVKLPDIPSSLWYTEPITIKMSTKQSDYTQMSVNDGAYATSFALDQDGIHTLKITFKNPLTNQETTPISVQVKMDKHKPVIEEIKQDAKDGKTFSILASDALRDTSIPTSGLDKIKYTIYQVVTSTKKTKLEEKEIDAADLTKLTTTASGNIEICAYAIDKAKWNGEEKCTDFTIAAANEETKKILEAENAAGTIEINEAIPDAAKFKVEDITKKTTNNEMFNDKQQVNLALRMSLSTGSLSKTAKVEIPLTKEILSLTNKAYYKKGSDGTLKKLDAKVVNDKLVFETKSLGDIFVITPKETKADPDSDPDANPDSENGSTTQTPADEDKNIEQVKKDNETSDNGVVSTGDMTSIGWYLLLAAGAVLSMSFYVHQRRLHK